MKAYSISTVADNVTIAINNFDSEDYLKAVYCFSKKDDLVFTLDSGDEKFLVIEKIWCDQVFILAEIDCTTVHMARQLLKDIKKEQIRSVRISSIKKSGWGFMSFIAALACISLVINGSSALTRYNPTPGVEIESLNPNQFTGNTAINSIKANTAGKLISESQTTPQIAQQPASAPNVGIIGERLKIGSSSGDYSVSLNPNAASASPVLYVFSDALCSHCRNAEPLLEALANTGVNVQIFPVSVINGRMVEPATYDVLCKAGIDRTNAWKKLMSGPADQALGQAPVEQCDGGKIALENNNNFYRAARFEGTPTFVRADGKSYGSDKPLNAVAMKQWLMGTED